MDTNSSSSSESSSSDGATQNDQGSSSSSGDIFEKKELVRAGDGISQMPVPSGSETGPRQPLPHDPASDVGGSHAGNLIEAAKGDHGARKRRHANAVEAGRKPVQGARSQDADPAANRGVTITTEHGKPVAHPGSTLQ